MKIVKTTLIIAIVAVVSFSFVSCEKADYSDTQLMKASELEASTNGLNASQSDDGLVQTRARSSNWTEVELPPTGISTLYTYPANQVNSNTFYFSVYLVGPYTKVYVKTYSPSGEVRYEKMIYSGGKFSFSKSFYEDGTYHYRYFVNLYGNTLSPISVSKSFHVTINVPAVQNNYNSSNYEFARYNCTSWVAQKVNEMWGVFPIRPRHTNPFRYNMFPGYIMTNATTWKGVLVANGYIADSNPKPGDIAWWRKVGTPETNPLGFDENNNPYGHVAFVHKVYSDKSIEITEYNWPSLHTYHHVSRIYPSQSRYPDSFVHVQVQK